jgi:serine/threonine protein kinase/Tol biopolymer transport system component
MGIAVGDRLGRFEILGALGAGGMGAVYRARDPQLQRDVAIKVLPPEWSGDPSRRRRLEREARAAAGLSHPNIVAVHDFGVDDGVSFIVTELLHGETLRHRLQQRLPPHKAVEYGIQIASGLAAGHDRGTIHRDIKPENVFVTTEGLVKILDFGLARPIEGDSNGPAMATITIDGTRQGAVSGTAAYMSPEQMRGLAADHRSDIFSLGSVLFEMLAGFAPFRRPTYADTLSAVLNEEPQELTTIGQVDPALARIVRHCLEKKPEDRFQNARDVIFALQGLSTSPWMTTATLALRGRGRRIALIVTIVAAAATLGYMAGVRAPEPSPSAASPDIRRLTELPGLEEFPSISPDGRAVAFTGGVDGRRQIFVRLLAGGAPLAITRDPVDHQQPRWSPDGNAIVYFSPDAGGGEQGAIWTIPALGGSPRRLLASISGADVSRSGRLACFRLENGRIQLVTADLDGSDVRVVLPSSAGYHRYPRWSPDGRWIAFQRGDGVRDDIFFVSADGGEPRQLTHDRNVISGLTWLPSSDRILYASSRGNTVPYLPALRLWEIGLDGRAPRAVTAADAWYEQPDVHGTGLASAGRLRMRFDIWRFPVDRTPADNVRLAEQITRQTGQVLTPAPSPDGDDIAFLADHGGRANLWVMSTHTGEVRQITFEDDATVAVGVPIWSPDGQSIAFVSSKGHAGLDFGVWLVNPDGGNLRNVAPSGLGAAWSADGKWLYYCDTSAGFLKKVSPSGGPAVTVRSEPARNVIGVHDGTLYYMVERPLVDGRPEFEIHAAKPEDRASRLVAHIPASRVAPWQIVNPALSPDGQWLAMPLTDGVTTNIWALSTATGEWRQVTDFGGRAVFIARRVSWSPDGKSLLAAIGEGEADLVLLDGVM